VLAPARIRTTLVTGGSARAREAAIAENIIPGSTYAVLLEGMPTGSIIVAPSQHVSVQRIAPACLCCTGNLVLRVTLNRIVRRRPACLFIGLSSTDHLDQLRSWLQDRPYDQLLELTPDLGT
jgi:hypothetical protein